VARGARRRGRARRHPGLHLVLALALVLGGLAILRFTPGSPLAASGQPAALTQPTAAAALPSGATPSGAGSAAPGTPVPGTLLRPAPVTIRTSGFWSWALLDLGTGEIHGSANLAARSTTASMIKVWLAADYLRRADASGASPSADRLALLSKMIRDSDNEAAWTMWRELGEGATISRLIQLCQLTDSVAGSRWSLTQLSARDAARMGACIAGRRAAGPTWTGWLLNEMKLVRGTGDFGIRKAFPADVAAQTAIKNGWVVREAEGAWHLNCLAIGDGWVLSVLQRYPTALGFAHGGAVCRSVAAQLMGPP
jgi:hypothetical protein